MKPETVDWNAVHRASIRAETLARHLTIAWAKLDAFWIGDLMARDDLATIATALGYRVEKSVSDKQAHETMIAKRVAEDDR